MICSRMLSSDRKTSLAPSASFSAEVSCRLRLSSALSGRVSAVSAAPFGLVVHKPCSDGEERSWQADGSAQIILGLRKAIGRLELEIKRRQETIYNRTCCSLAYSLESFDRTESYDEEGTARPRFPGSCRSAIRSWGAQEEQVACWSS